MENLIPIGLIIVCIAGAIALLALAYLLLVLVKIIRNTVTNKVDPLLDDAGDMVKQAKPIIGKVDPLMDRVTLTIDAANLEIMRVDQILEDVNAISGKVAKASNSFDAVARKPLKWISSASSKVRDLINPYKNDSTIAGTVAINVDGGLEAMNSCIADFQQKSDVKAQARQEAQEARAVKNEETNSVAQGLKEAMYNKTKADTYTN